MESILERKGSGRNDRQSDNDHVANAWLRAGPDVRNRLAAAATFAALGVTLSGIHAATGLGIPCPWRLLTHTLCPFCGATTLGSDLLHGDFRAAWAANQFVFVLLVGLALVSIFWIVEILGGPALRLRGRLADQRLWYAVLGAAALVFAVLRNLVPLI